MEVNKVEGTRSRMGDGNKNESISHALLALGIILLLIVSIIIAWIIVCCERLRRKRKYRPGQQNYRNDPGGTITRSGASPLISRRLLVPKASQHLVIANKAFLSKSTPQLVGMDGGEEEEGWRMEGIVPLSTPLVEPLISTPKRHKVVVVPSVPRTRSEPLLPQVEEVKDDEGKGSIQELSIHDQIIAILGTFPSLGFDFFIPNRNSTPLRNGDDSNGHVDVEQGPESSVDGDVLLPRDVNLTPVSQIRNSPLKKSRPTTLTFLEEKRYDFLDVELNIETEVGGVLDDLPPLLETTL